jgi:hypothetical protein
LIASVGLGGVFTGVTTAANAGVGEDRAGLAAGLLNTGQQLGGALGLAILSALATARTSALLHAGDDTIAQAARHGYQRALNGRRRLRARGHHRRRSRPEHPPQRAARRGRAPSI